MAGKFFHTAHPHTLTDIRLTLLTQIVIFWGKQLGKLWEKITTQSLHRLGSISTLLCFVEKSLRRKIASRLGKNGKEGVTAAVTGKTYEYEPRYKLPPW